MKLIYKVEDKPQFHQLVIFAFQQLLAIMAATIAVPLIIKNGMNTAAALFGAGVGTLVYVDVYKRQVLRSTKISIEVKPFSKIIWRSVPYSTLS